MTSIGTVIDSLQVKECAEIGCESDESKVSQYTSDYDKLRGCSVPTRNDEGCKHCEIVTSNKNLRIAYVTCSVIITIFRPVAKGGSRSGRTTPIHWHPAGQVGAAARSLYQM